MSEPYLFILLGGTGDLARRKLLPAIARHMADGADGDLVLLAAARGTSLTDDAYRQWARQALEESAVVGRRTADWCDRCVHYQPLSGEAGEYEELARRIAEVEREHGLPGNRIFYLALPPAAFAPAIERLGEAGLNRSPGWTRLVIEKPFGHDLESAISLNAIVHRHFDESQVYRIDHYLGKDTVQNLLVFRFANPIFEAVWNRSHVQQVTVTVAEDVGIGTRAGYYERVGALRDMIQNHLTQLMTLVAMEVPAAFEADAIRAEKVKVLRAAEPIAPDDVVYGQYTAGTVDGAPVPGYREEADVHPESTTPTWAAVRLRIANWRWQGVPFVLRTGKRMPARSTQIVVTFRRAPVALFRDLDGCDPREDQIVIDIQPHEGFSLRFDVKVPGAGMRVASQQLRFDYADAFEPLPDAYVTLLAEVAEGDQTLFVRADEVEAAWRLYTPVLGMRIPTHPYAAGSLGPAEAERLLVGGEREAPGCGGGEP